MVKLKFVGTGSAFNTVDMQSNMVIMTDTENMLIDCGSFAPFMLGDPDTGIGVNNGNIHKKISAVYISHQHADHIGGLEWLALCTYFNPDAGKLLLFGEHSMLDDLWHESLKGGLNTIEGMHTTLKDYFNIVPFDLKSELAKEFVWSNIVFQPIQTCHVMGDRRIVNSYGLRFEVDGYKVFITTDTQFCPNQIKVFYEWADVIFQDCETTPFKSNVHAHFSDLCTLPPEIRSKMWLYHYAPNPEYKAAEASGFKGFVKKGQEFSFPNYIMADK